MKRYSTKKISKIIKYYRKRGLIEASIGMVEDWFWTASTIYKDDNIKKDYLKDLHPLYSTWATPIIELRFNNRTILMECYRGQSKDIKPEWFNTNGCMAKPVQEHINSIEIQSYKFK